MQPGLVVLMVVVLLALGLAGLIVAIYNGLITVRNNVQKSWKNIDVVLQQRNDELPKLIETCRAYMKHETDLLTKITQIRTDYAMAKEIKDKIAAENQMGRLLGQLKMVWEQYPDLKAVQSFLQIQGRVSEIESKIADYREMFNDAVNIYNIQTERFPDLVLARIMNYQRQAFLEVPEGKKADVKMDFS